MKDPFFIPQIPALSKAVQPWADRYGLPTLSLHIHEVIVFTLFYTFIQMVISPVLSTWLFPSHYPRNSRGKKANWDAHVVSLVQSVLINGMALWVMFVDDERNQMDWQQRIWGYTGAAGLVQAMATGYFVWDLIMTVSYLDVFGLGLLAHASSALAVYSLGFKPFLNYYGCTFILYELSTPFLNIHWFFDKLNMTGSKAQLYNGITLLATFFSCRLVWGTIQSAFVWRDMWRAVHTAPDAGYAAAAALNSTLADPDENMMAFATDAGPIPVWLAGVYIASNITLNTLNWHWFFKMITAVKKRFEPPKPAAEKGPNGAVSSAEATGAGKALGAMRKRRSTIEGMVPDSEELREGTIQ
ncbi:TLC domain-containing protein [Phialemonium atrogriseum]|uniref:TLC domain-containing protein n=1 Tax=Phialemonium atrogriseum TaxID=1093897 RepID=A0AAJ0C903_9PEZI|nr:TLC domain-containing protein [Phialemonium atrogriseum]KAK1769896.1 TLC domain-containing protein [Phialemonium atrogriseum]